MRGLIRCCLFLCFPVLLWAQDGVQVKRERVFTGSGLYGFMNGGAEQFLEYGVSRLTARDVVYKGEDYTHNEITKKSIKRIRKFYARNEERNNKTKTVTLG